MIFNVRGNMGLKIMKECKPGSRKGDPLRESSRSIDKVKEIIRIHELFFEEGIGPKVGSEIVEIEFDSETLSNFLPNLPMPLEKEDQRWYGFWIETLVPELNFFLDLYFKNEKRFAEKINNIGIRRFNICPATFINLIVKRCYKTKFHYFVNNLKIVCLRNEIYRNAHNRIGTQNAINELLNPQNYFYTRKGFKLFDVDASNGIGPIVMNREKLISLIKDGAQFPVKSRPTQYQAVCVNDINLLGGRNSCADRLVKMDFDFTLFENASLLDMGCNIGSFCFEAQKHGANLTVGIDSNDEAIEAAKRLRDYANITNMVFITHFFDQDLFINIKNVALTCLLKGVVGQTKYDIVLALSIVNHVRNKRKLFQQLDQMTNKLLVIEGHADQTEELYRSYLLKYTYFSKVEFKGYSVDRSVRPVLFCWK